MELEIEKIKQGALHKRTVTNKDMDDGLSASIKEHGVLEPLIVRRMNGGYELVAGSRRLQCAKRAGLISVPVIVKELTDEQAREIQIVENIQRESFDPIDEAEAFQVLLNGSSPEDVASKVGKSEYYVRARMRLLVLGKKGREALRSDRITVGAAMALARLEDESEQNEILKRIVVGDKDTPPIDQSRMRDCVERELRDLSVAPFDIKDPELVKKAGACTSCPKRTGSQFVLPGIDAKVGKDRCTDAACFRSKLDAYWKAFEKQIIESGAGHCIPDREAHKMFTDYGQLHAEAHQEWCDASKEGAGLGQLPSERWSFTVLEHIKKNKIEVPSEETFYGRDRGGFPHLLLKRAFVRKMLRKPRTPMTDTEKSEKKKVRAEKEATREHAKLVSVCVKRMLDSERKIDPMDGLRAVVMARLEANFLGDQEIERLGLGPKGITGLVTKAGKTDSAADLVKIVVALDASGMANDRHSRAFELSCEAFRVSIEDTVEELGRAAANEHAEKRKAKEDEHKEEDQG